MGSQVVHYRIGARFIREGAMFYGKAMECLKALREGCLAVRPCMCRCCGAHLCFPVSNALHTSSLVCAPVIQSYEEAAFNTYLEGVKAAHERSPVRLLTQTMLTPAAPSPCWTLGVAQFWAEVRKAKITLIHDEESGDVSVTKAQADEVS